MYEKKPDLTFLNKIAKETNSINLPNIPENPNILLPPPEYSLIRNNFQVFSEDLSNKLNNPSLENDLFKDDEELNSLNNKKRQSLIGIKRHNEKLSLSSTFKKRRLESEGNLNNNINIKSKTSENNGINFNNNQRDKNVKFEGNMKNNFRIKNDQEQEDLEEKSDFQDNYENDEFNNIENNENEENDGDEYDQMEQNSNYDNEDNYNDIDDDF